MRLKALSLVLIVLGMSFLALTMTAGEAKATPHVPIVINGDSQLQTMATAEGWPGSGSVLDPYIIKDLVIDAQDASNGINIKNTELHLVIRNCTINNTSDHGIYLKNVENAMIEDCEVFDAVDGIRLDQCNNLTIQNNRLHDNLGNGLNVRQCENVVILDGNSSNNVADGIRFFSSNNCSMQNCDLYKNYNGASVVSSTLVVVNGNRFIGCLNYGIFSQSSSHDTLADNHITTCDDGIWVFLSDYEDVTGNNITHSNEYAIVISDGSDHCNVVNNEVGLNTYDGIQVSGCPRTNVTDNLVYANALNGIMISNSPQTLIEGNRIVGVKGDGLRVATSNDCQIINNNITDNNIGIYLFNSTGGVLMGNHIGENGLYGISLDTCVGNSVYGNTLSANNGADALYNLLHLQAKDTSVTGNSWNYSGALNYHGNMWMDWLLPDHDNNGIVDEPYILKGGAQDNAPLTNVDSESPVLHLLTPYDHSIINTAYAQVSWEGWDNGSGLVGYSISFDSSSSWMDVGMNTSYLWASISEGTHVVKVNATDGGGLFTVSSHTFQVDRTAPSITFQSPANNSATDQAIAVVSWTGTDAITSVNDYHVRLNNGPWTTTTQTTFTTPAMGQGSNQVWVNATDTAGNWRIYYMNIFLDSVGPELVITDPVSGSLIDTNSVMVVWTVIDDGVGMGHCDIRVDGGPWINVSTATSYDIVGLTEGAHVFHIKAIDKLGMVTSANVSFAVDLFAPNVVINSPGNNTYINEGSVLLEWTGTDTGLGIDHYEVEVDLGAWIDTGTVHSWSVNGLTQGEHTLGVMAVDRMGRNSTTSVVVIVDHAGPSIDITDPVSGSLIETSSVTVVWTVDGGGVGLDHCDIMIDSGAWVNVSTDTSYEIIGLTEGAHVVQVRAFNVLGNVSSDSISFAVDLFAPIVVIDSPANNTNIIGGSVLLEWTGSDTGFGIDHYEVQVDSDAWNDRGTALSVAITGLTSGEHTLRVKAVDHTGRNSTAYVVVNVDVIGPSIDINYPVENQIITVSQLNVTWTIDGPVSDLDRFEVQVDGGTWQDRGSEQWVNLDLANGRHSVTVRGYDKSGNMGQDRVNFSVDLVGPRVVIAYPSEGSLVNNITVGIFYDVNDISGIHWLNYSLNGVTWVTLPYPSDHVFLQLADGPVHFMLHATDFAGWESMAWLNFTLDNDAPAVTNFGPNGTASTNDVIFITYNEEIQSGTLVVLVNGVERTYTVSGRTYNVTMQLALGHTYVVAVSGGLDQAGNRIGNFTWSFITADSGVISGKVVNSDGDPIEGAYVRAGSISTITDFQGEFVLTLPPGAYNLTITASGKEDRTIAINVTGDVPLGDLTMDSTSGGMDMLLIGAIVGVIAIVAIVAFLLIRRRKG